MGHRHLFTSSQMFESEHDQNWNPMQTDQTFGHMVTGTESSDNGPLFYPIESMFSDGINFSPHWNPLPRSASSSSSQLADAPPPFPPEVSGPPHDHPFQRHAVSSTGPFSTVPETYPSSSHGRRTFQGAEASFVELTMGSNGGVPMPHHHHHQKRKSPGVPSSRYHHHHHHHHGAGSSSSELPMGPPLESCHEKAGLDSQPAMPWDRVAANPGYDQGNALSIRAGGESARNVRSRSALDLESDPGYSLVDHPTPMDISGQPSAGLTLEWSHFGAPSHGNNVLVSDSSGFSQDPTRFLLGNNDPGNSSVPQSYPSSSSTRGVRSVYSQRPNPSPSSGSRASSSSLSHPGLRLGHPGPSEEGLHSRQARAFSSNSVGWRNGDRSGRLRISHAERYRLQSDERSHDRFASQGFMIVDRSSAAYGSRNSLDQHREMRLDVDNMSYEELLALGERIGTVSTGVSADSMPKCVTETIYCSSDQMQDEDEEACAICLEEYKHMDDVGTLKSCGHDYHVECIKKWLEMKNLCPICKRPALADDRLKGK